MEFRSSKLSFSSAQTILSAIFWTWMQFPILGFASRSGKHRLLLEKPSFHRPELPLRGANFGAGMSSAADDHTGVAQQNARQDHGSLHLQRGRSCLLAQAPLLQVLDPAQRTFSRQDVLDAAGTRSSHM